MYLLEDDGGLCITFSTCHQKSREDQSSKLLQENSIPINHQTYDRNLSLDQSINVHRVYIGIYRHFELVGHG